MSDLRNKLIRLAHENPELRESLVPLISKTAGHRDLQWAADQIENALQMLDDVATVLSQDELIMDYDSAARTSSYLRRMSADLDKHKKALERDAR